VAFESKLQAHLKAISRWRAEGKSYPDIVKCLAEKGVKTHRNTVLSFCKIRGIKRWNFEHYKNLCAESPQDVVDQTPAIEEDGLSASDRIRNRIKKEASDKNSESKKSYTKEEMDKMLAAERERKRKEMRGE